MVICTHRPALPTIVAAIGKYGNDDQFAKLNETLTLAPGEMTVVHMTKTALGKKRQIVAIETYTPGPPNQ